MGILSALLANWRLGLYAAAALAIAFGGWYVKSKVARAAEADRLETSLIAAAKKVAEANDARILLSAQLEEERGKIEFQVTEVIKRVPVLVTVGKECNLDPTALRALNQARGHQ